MAKRGEMFKYSLVDTPNKSWFDMSFDYVLSMNFGELVPTTMMEVIAGDTIHAKTSVFGRLAPMVAPAYGKVNLFSYHFYVRNRDIWKSWKAFIDDAEDLEPWQNPAGFVPPVMPYIDIRKVLYKSKLFGQVTGLSYDGDEDSLEFVNLTDQVAILRLYRSDGQLYSKIQWRTNTFIGGGNFDTGDVYIAFIPNKSDIVNVPNAFYNPFSESTLFDYLGVDTSALYKKNFEDYLQFVASNNLTPSSYVDDVNGLDIQNFLNTHAVLSMSYVMLADAPLNHNTIDSEGHKIHAGSQLDPLPDAYNPPIWYYDDESSKISSLSLRAYHFCYMEYFRDQNYMKVNENVDFTRDGEDIDWSLSSDVIFDYLVLKYKCWEHDPYTSGLPGPQRGTAVRFLPDAPVNVSRETTTYSAGDNSLVTFGPQGLGSRLSNVTDNQTGNNLSLTVDFSAATIENFRFQNATQRIAEKMARGGGRYYQLMQILFGEEIPSVNLDRPIYLGGDRTPIQISEVLQTSASDLTTNQPLGDMAGRAVILGNDDYLEYHCQEHGFYIELVAAIPRVSYQQGIDPMFLRKVRLDYPLDDYAQLGEEAIPTSELYYSANESKDNTVFAYQSRYYQWKYNRDRVSGSFKSSMNHWTFSRIFDSAPVAGKKFLESKPDYRQFAVTDSRSEHLYLTMWHDIQVNRGLPVFGVPTL